MNVCTIVARNYLVHARVIASSFREHHPDRRFWTLILDAPESADRAHEPFRSLYGIEIGVDATELQPDGRAITWMPASTSWAGS